MKTALHTIIHRVQRLRAEMGYAGRRSFELQTGIAADHSRLNADDLVALYADDAK